MLSLYRLSAVSSRASALITAIFSLFSFTGMAETADIAVFDDHEKYVEAASGYGVSWQLLALAAKQQGIELQTQPSSWDAALKRVKAKKTDLVFAAFKTADRAVWAAFSLPLYKEGSAIFARPDNPVQRIEDIDVQTSTIGVSSASVQEMLAQELGFKNIYGSRARMRLYTLLQNERLDYLLFGQSILSYYCLNYTKEKNRHCMKQIGEPLQSARIHVLTDKTNQRATQLLVRLNAGLQAIKNTPEARAVFEQYGLDASEHQQWIAALGE
ncbi:substrate-binding periplasmic protein [Alteromonas sp. CYL-A6]|uniref:substrate-binding periplasmic protein n=1 Tax=Alteromonas nitratireducens TaxID=3390813 RepID=UPI0034BBF27E